MPISSNFFPSGANEHVKEDLNIGPMMLTNTVQGAVIMTGAMLRLQQAGGRNS